MPRVPVPANHPAAIQPAVATASTLAARAGRSILEQGGNAVDAAVAAAWALCASAASAPGIGERGTLLFFSGGAIHALDDDSRGPTLEHAQRRWGRLRREEVLAPAISIAEQAFPATLLHRKEEPATGMERTSIRATFRGLEVVTAPGRGLQLLVALKLLERLLPCARRATREQWSSAVALAVQGAIHASGLHPVAPDELSPASMRYLVGDERIGLLARSVQRGTRVPLPDADDCPGATHLGIADHDGNIATVTLHPSAGRRSTSSLVQVISSIVDQGLSLDEAVAVDGRGKLR